MGTSLGVLFAALASISWSFSGIFQKFAYEDPKVTPSHAVLFSSSINTVALWIVVALHAVHSAPPVVDLRGLFFFVLGGLSGTVFGRLLLATSVAKVGPARNSATKIAGPVVSLTLAWAILGESISPMTALGIGLVLGGVLLLVTEGARGRQEVAAAAEPGHGAAGAAGMVNPSPPPKDYLWGAGAAVMFAVAENARKVGLLYLPSAAWGAAIGATSASLWSLTMALMRGQVGSLWRLPRRTKLFLVGHGISTSLASECTFLALLHAQVAVVSAITATEPLTTMVLSRLIIGRAERITPRLLASAALVVVGAAVVAGFRRR